MPASGDKPWPEWIWMVKPKNWYHGPILTKTSVKLRNSASKITQVHSRTGDMRIPLMFLLLSSPALPICLRMYHKLFIKRKSACILTSQIDANTNFHDGKHVWDILIWCVFWSSILANALSVTGEAQKVDFIGTATVLSIVLEPNAVTWRVRTDSSNNFMERPPRGPSQPRPIWGHTLSHTQYHRKDLNTLKIDRHFKL